MIIFTDRFIPQRFDGVTIGPVSLIRPRCRDDQGLIAHEKTHQCQFWRTLGVGSLLCLLSKAWCLRYEIEAYREQLKFSPGDVDRFAKFLANDYGIGITEAQARQYLINAGK